MSEQKNYRTLDFIRIVASFFVVLVHVHLPIPHAYYTMAWARFAVPVFFMINGFFLYSPADSKESILKKIRKTLIRIIKLTSVSVLLYIIVNSVACCLKGQEPLFWLTSKFSLKLMLQFVLLNYSDFLFPPLWYLLAYIYVLAIVYFLVKFDFINRISFIIPVLILINIIMSGILKLDWYYQGNWLITGLPFVLAGNYLRFNDRITQALSKPVLCLLIVFGTVITYVESFNIPGQFFFWGTVPISFGLFILGINSDTQWPEAGSFIGRKITMYIFIIHCALRNLYYAVFDYPIGIMAFLLPLIIFFLSGLIGYLVYLLGNIFHSNKKAADCN